MAEKIAIANEHLERYRATRELTGHGELPRSSSDGGLESALQIVVARFDGKLFACKVVNEVNNRYVDWLVGKGATPKRWDDEFSENDQRRRHGFRFEQLLTAADSDSLKRSIKLDDSFMTVNHCRLQATGRNQGAMVNSCLYTSEVDAFEPIMDASGTTALPALDELQPLLREIKVVKQTNNSPSQRPDYLRWWLQCLFGGVDEMLLGQSCEDNLVEWRTSQGAAPKTANTYILRHRFKPVHDKPLPCDRCGPIGCVRTRCQLDKWQSDKVMLFIGEFWSQVAQFVPESTTYEQ